MFILVDTDSFDEENQYPLFQSMVKDLVSHSIDQTEYALLKLIVLFDIRKFIDLFDLILFLLIFIISNE